MNGLVLFVLAAVLEIGGCYAFWAWARDGKSGWWLVPGVIALIGFAWLLTRVNTAFAGRAYAAYGGIYVVMTLVWLWVAEGQRPTLWDVSGAGLCILGTLVILAGSRAAAV